MQPCSLIFAAPFVTVLVINTIKLVHLILMPASKDFALHCSLGFTDHEFIDCCLRWSYTQVTANWSTRQGIRAIGAYTM